MDRFDDPALARMQSLIETWEQVSDQRTIFLRTYSLMTSNMLSAIHQDEFNDSAWVDRLLHHFAEYYFDALAAYEQDPATAPAVWRLANNATRDPGVLALQKLLLGVNAHINYDLVLALVDILEPEWDYLPEDHRLERYADHCRVNEIIGSTIDAVQDEVLEPAMPALDLIDRIFGSLDERLISRLISNWRDEVWQKAVYLLENKNRDEQERYIQQVEKEALRLGNIIS